MRKSNRRPIRKGIVIFSEGETERIYFDMLIEKYNYQMVYVEGSPKIIAKKGKGSAKKLIEHAISTIAHEQRFKELKIELKVVVFDKDDLDIKDVQQAVSFAKEQGFEVLYSNECFDYWILRHFEECKSSINRKAIFEKLTKHTGFENYVKHKADVKLKEVLRDKVHIAMSSDFPEMKRSNLNQNPYTNAPNIIKLIFKREEY